MLLVTILALCLGLSRSEFRQTYYTSLKQQTLTTGTIKEVTVDSRIACAVECSNIERCVASEWQENGHICRLKYDGGHEGPLEDILYQENDTNVITYLKLEPCRSSPCQNNGTCIEGENSFTCVCPSGHTGVTCQEVDDCASSPCQNGGTCTDGDNTFTCTCSEWYTGVTCADCIPDPTHGVVSITVNGTDHNVFKDSVDCGRWIVFVKRESGAVNFAQYWTGYVNGFGKPASEYWLGLELLHHLTNARPYELRVDVEDYDSSTAWAKYGTFHVGDAETNYTLTVTGYDEASTAGKSMDHHNGKQFSTRDADHDISPGDCSNARGKGGWWYGWCHYSLPTGIYYPASEAGVHHLDGIIWYHFKNDRCSYKAISLKIRPTA